MPKYNMTDEDMDTGEYGAEAAPGAGATPPENTETPSVDEENEAQAEILIAKKELPSGTKAGDTVTFKVAADFGDEFSLRPVKEAMEETVEEPPSVEAAELAALDTEGME